MPPGPVWGMGQAYLNIYIYIYICQYIDIVSVTNRVQIRAHAKNQPRFYVESRHDSFRPSNKSMKIVKMTNNLENMFKK